MDELTIQLSALAGTLAILLKNYSPAIMAMLAKIIPKKQKAVDDVGCVVAFGILRGRLTPDTAKIVWAEIEPVASAQEVKP